MQLIENARRYLFWTLNALLGAAFLVELFSAGRFPGMVAALIVLAAVTGVMALNRLLPFQNVLSAAFITAVIGGAVHGLSAQTKVPLGPIVFNTEAGSQLFYTVPWTVPLLWVAAIFTARGVARIILRPWRKVKNYGYWLIALTSLLVMAFDIALEPYAWHVKHLWLWQPTRLALSWHGATLLNFVGWGLTALLILMFITPSLIRKQPGSSNKVDFHPLVVWLAALLLFATGTAGGHLWWSVGADGVIAAVTTALAVRGATW